MAVHPINAGVHYASLTGLSISLGLSAVALVLGLSSILFLGLIWCVQDYRAFKALGPGGPPYNIRGWMTVAFLVKPFTLSARDTTWTGDYPTSGAHKSLIALPLRKGGRPDVRGIAPQRQFSQRPLPEMNQVSLDSVVDPLADETRAAYHWPSDRLGDEQSPFPAAKGLLTRKASFGALCPPLASG